MEEYTGWRPDSGPSPMDLAIAARTDDEGRIRLRSDANHFWGCLSAWMLLGLAAIANNASGLTGEDALSPIEAAAVAVALFAASVGALIVLGRSHAVVADKHLEVRNPLRTYEVPVVSVRSLEPGLVGFPALLLEGGSIIHVWGLGGNLRDELEGGSEDAAILKALIARANGHEFLTSRPTVRTRWSVFDRSLIVLVVAWGLYACSFTIV